MRFTAPIYGPVRALAECGAADGRALCGESRPRAVNRAKGARPRCTFVNHDAPMLVRTSLLSVLPASRGGRLPLPGTIEAGWWGNLTAVVVLTLMLAGPALVPELRSGRMIMLFVALAAIGMPALHFSNNGNRSRYSDALLFIWCLIALGVNGLFSLMPWVSTPECRQHVGGTLAAQLRHPQHEREQPVHAERDQAPDEEQRVAVPAAIAVDAEVERRHADRRERDEQHDHPSGSALGTSAGPASSRARIRMAVRLPDPASIVPGREW